MGDRKATEARLLKKAGELIEREGFEALGINRLAGEAGVSKVLIYRYFGGLDGLLRRWAREAHFWNRFSPGELQLQGLSLAELRLRAEKLFVSQWRFLRAQPAFRALLRWHLASDTPLSREIMAEVETAGRQVMEAFLAELTTEDPEEELSGLVALMIGGIYYLGLMADRADVFNRLPLHLPEGADPVESSIRRFCGVLIPFRGDGDS